MFACLKEHIPIDELWHKYQQWSNNYVEYVGLLYRIRYNMLDEVHNFIKSKDLGILHECEGFYELVLDCIQYINVWKDILAGRPHDDRRDIIDCQPSRYKPRRFEYRVLGETGRQTLMANGYRVLEARDALATVESFQSFADSFLSSKEVTRLRKIYCKLRDLESSIQSSLDEILIRQDYISHTCRLCPSTQSKT
jgi:hypothetical protein